MPDIFAKPNQTSAHIQQPHLSRVGFFTAFSQNPRGVIFVNQEPGEDVVLFLRRHFVTNLKWIIFTGFLLCLPPLFFALLPFASLPFSLPQMLWVALAAFYYLIAFGYALVNFISWFYNIGIVTQQRIVDIDSSNILHHNMSTAYHDEVVEVEHAQTGVLQSFFNYGDVHIQTEAIKSTFEYQAAPNPAKVSDIILDLREEMKRKGHHHA